MPPRKKATRALKRNRTEMFPHLSASSPPQDIDEFIPFSPKPAKRARRSSNPELSYKKIRLSVVATPAASPSQFQTPYPSTLSQEQTYRLPSSVPIHSEQLSPIPASRGLVSRPTSSHKENVVRRASKKSASLHSPFHSRPNSAHSSPQKLASTSLKRTLSDTNYNPNVPQSSSTTSSPIRLLSPLRTRRPSAPSPPRPGSWLSNEIDGFDFDFHFAAANSTPFSIPSAMDDVDFDRPPSSLSFYGGDFDGAPIFDDEVKGPLMLNSAYTAGLGSVFDDDEFVDSEPDLTLSQDPFGASYGLKSLPTRARSPWLSDSIILSQNPAQEHAYMHSPSSSDVGMVEDEDMVFAFDPAPSGFEMVDSDSEDPVLRSSEGELKQMFDDLALEAPKSRPLINRTRSLEAEDTTAASSSQPKAGRDRRGTIRASDFPLMPARRSRSGTITATAPTTATAAAKRTRSGTIIAAPPAAPTVREEGEVDETEELSGWCSNGWSVAAPPSPVVTRPRPRPRRLSWKPAPLSPEGRSEGGFGSGLLPSPVLERKGKGKAPRIEDVDVVMEEDEEEL
ncbi:hypothetical protein FB45DRAFT_1003968 [Roridomyces roridus]|uniref:Uncharacterized protein n=1 Tax=Roridomyces roridus TaxID=1738132 RepID=A0AAD7BWB4_9AGAR|nr:hypothetical protein FB45DRAFT_1003968 [Roridomyces roridus]